jgi:hypothetical protein
MRRYIKNELLEMVQALMNAHESTKKNIEQAEVSYLIEMLTNCQQSAIYIGEKIEESEGEGTRSVTLLERYCEEVYQLSLVMQDINQAKKAMKHIHKLLHEISESIKYHIMEDKKEVVFLPYSASMWDSLESVWMAAREDPNCNTHVIPIPYFEKSSDGTLGQMHYEGAEYPEYVPITSWEEYRIADMRPDIIYIHNPYDSHNKVTSVHPDFYSKELRKHTDMLVYIPYFVNSYNVPEHFCVLPGTMYANRVIVQSEQEKEIYIRELRLFEKENNCVGLFGNLEEKFLALGSPKFDKVTRASKEHFRIPEEWSKYIEHSDGRRKKVILYNTTIQAFLNNNEAYLVKLQDVLNLFYEKQDDFVLLWRPHPLMETTIASMRPELLERYLQILNEYKEKAYGIYDDTSDLHRAIAFSDAYYGDGSSLVALYKLTGKPCMIQKVENLK